MMSRQATKWMIGISSVALFTGILYAEQTVLEHKKVNTENGLAVNQFETFSDKEGFIHNEEELRRIQNMDESELRKRENWISGLDWGQNELTLQPRSGDTNVKIKSHVRTRRS